MQSTSTTFKNNIYAPVRRTAGRVTFDISDQTAAGDVSSITTTSESPLSVKAQLVNKVRTPTFKVATNEKDRFKLDGSFSFPDDTIVNNGELGWSSATICDSSGVFTPNQTLTFNFTSNHSSAGLTITFDQSTGEYATDFDMTAYDASNAVIDSVSVVGNTDVVSTPLGQLLNYRKVSVTIKKWSVPNRRARVFEVDFGVVRQYGDDGLINMSLTEEFDMMTSKLPSPELKFTVDNVDRAFNILNPTGFYKYLQQKQQIIAEIGLELPDGSFEYVQLGQYLLQNWQSNEGSITATFTARTNLDSMSSFDYENLSASTKTLYQFAVDMFTLCGITNYSIDTALQSINTNSLVKKANCRDILQMIAIAGCANIYVTRDNKITLKCNRTRKVRYIRDWLNGSTSNLGNFWVDIQAIDTGGINKALGKSVTSSVAFDGSGAPNDPTGAAITDGITTTTPYTGLVAVGLQWVKVDLGAVYDIADIKVWHYHGDLRTFYNTKTEISEDGVTWSTVFDSAISGTYAESSTGRTYSMETVMTPLAPVDSADFDNMFEEPKITLEEAIKRVEVTYWSNLSTSAIIGVNSTTDTLGNTLKLENNTLINDSTRATAVANWLLAQIKYKARYAINWRGNPAIELNDVMAFENSYGADTSAYITRIELDYGGYLTARMQAKGAVN